MDRGTPVGFQNIAKARQWILDEQDAHVIAPVSIYFPFCDCC